MARARDLSLPFRAMDCDYHGKEVYVRPYPRKFEVKQYLFRTATDSSEALGKCESLTERGMDLV